MDIALVRVDNRLVHGQILEAWVPYLHICRIVVVDDQVASDFFRETVIRMAVPSEIDVTISGLREFGEAQPCTQADGQKTIILFSTIQDALAAYRFGFHYERLNIGNVYNENCRICCTPSVLLSETDLRDITTLHNEGVQIELQRVPREKSVDIFDIVKRATPSSAV
ncbi:MAG: PTS sugar transporter subunit IIB [Deltaproteobacteria bacterium]|nr:PTS sugar transporter subunit IIB [Deltaproteobacteria bacterium]